MSKPDDVLILAKVHRAKTRKDPPYFMLRFVIPKKAVEALGVKEGEYIFFKATKARVVEVEKNA